MIGSLLSVIYLAFAVAVVALVGSRVGSVIAAVGIAVVVLLAMPIVGIVDAVGRWLPSHLVGAPVDLAAGGSASGYLGAAAVSIAATAALIAWTVRSAQRREL